MNIDPQNEESRERGRFGRVLARLVLVQPGEGKALALSAAYFFFLLFGYFIIRPIRDEMGVAGGIRNLKWLWLGTLVAMLAAHPVYAWLVGRLPRRRFIPLVYRFFALNLLAFWLAIEAAPAERQVNLGRAFYIWTSVFNLFAVSVFWSLMSDLFTREQGKRLFGAIAVGGTLGALTGSVVTAALTSGVSVGGVTVSVRPVMLLLVSAALLEVAAQCVRWLSRLSWAQEGTGGAVAGKSREPGPGVWEGLRLLGTSPYLVLIALYMLCYAVTNTFLYVEQARIAERFFPDRGQRTAFFAQVNLWTQVATVAVQVLLTGRVLRSIGVRRTLLAMPLFTIGGFAALLAHPAAWTLIAFQAASRAVHHGVDRPTREVLYTVVGQEARYKTKQFIDTFVYRFGDQAGIWAESAMAVLAVPSAAAAIGIGAVWAGVAALLGVQHGRRVGAGTERA